jgi:hypothetical protein
MKIQLWLLALACLFWTPQPGIACSCFGHQSVCGAYAAAEAVFIGTVQKVEAPNPPAGASLSQPVYGQLAQVAVEQVFKGAPPASVLFYSGGSSCDPFYQIGQRRLFYAIAFKIIDL